MIRLGLRDLQWRRRRFVLVVFVVALAFGLAVTVSGVSRQLEREGSDTLGLLEADAWVVPAGASGPFTTSYQFDRQAGMDAVRSTGARAATPILVGKATVGVRDVNIVGYDPDGAVLPHRLAAARASTAAPDGAIVDVTLDRRVGDTISLGGRDLPVVAEVSGTAFLFSAPTVFLPITTVQELFFAGHDVASAVMVTGSIDEQSIAGGALAALSRNEVLAEFDRVIESTSGTIGIVTALLWTMAVGIVAAIVYLTVLERTRDLATLKAIGTSTRSLVGGVAIQAAVIAVAGAALAIPVSRLIVPAFDFPVSIPVGAYLQLLVVALVVGVLASSVAVRRLVRIDPVLAFGGNP